MVTPGSSSQKNYLLLTQKSHQWGSALCFKAALSQEILLRCGVSFFGSSLLQEVLLPKNHLKMIHLERETLSCMCNTQPPQPVSVLISIPHPTKTFRPPLFLWGP